MWEARRASAKQAACFQAIFVSCESPRSRRLVASTRRACALQKRRAPRGFHFSALISLGANCLGRYFVLNVNDIYDPFARLMRNVYLVFMSRLPVAMLKIQMPLL